MLKIKYNITSFKANNMTNKIKKIIKKILPTFLLSKIQLFRSLIKNFKFRNLNTKQVFTEIYKKKLWGKSKNGEFVFFSGSGSHNNKNRSKYVKSVLKHLPKNADVVDLGCGDFVVGSKIRPFCNRYIACDIVPELISFNKKKFKNINVDFRVLDIIEDGLPHGDVVFLRQVLQHLSNKQIIKITEKLKTKYKIIFLTEHISDSNMFKPNLDKPTGLDTRIGYLSGVVLTEPPFNLVVKKEKVICEFNEHSGIIRTIMYTL